jgi:hypothetical protein
MAGLWSSDLAESFERGAEPENAPRRQRDGRKHDASGAVARWLLLALLVSVLPVPQPQPTSAQTPRVEAAAGGPAEINERLTALVDAHRAMLLTLDELRGQMAAVQEALAELQESARRSQERFQTEAHQLEEMREEVRGLYVESSGLKGDIAQLGERVEGFEGSLGSFRSSAGIVVAVVIVLQLVLVGLTFRGHS